MCNDISGECQTRFSLWRKIWNRTMVLYWFWKEVVFYQWSLPTRWMGQNGRTDGGIRRTRTPSLSSHESIVQRSAQEQRRWKVVDPLLCRSGHYCFCFFTNISVNQFSLYGAVAEMCQGKPFTIEQCDPLSWSNQVPHSCKVWSRQKYFWICLQGSSIATIWRTNRTAIRTRKKE